MITGELGFYTVMSTLITEVDNELATTAAGRTDRVCVVSGAIAWDECECGQLASSVVRWFYTEDFPEQRGEAQFTACDASFIAADILINLTRCAPQPEGESIAPTCAALDAAASEHVVDAHVLRNSVVCKLAEMKANDDIVDYMVREQRAVGPEGMCVGSELEIVVALENR